VLNSASVVNSASGSPVAPNAISGGEDRVEHALRPRLISLDGALSSEARYTLGFGRWSR